MPTQTDMKVEIEFVMIISNQDLTIFYAAIVKNGLGHRSTKALIAVNNLFLSITFS